MTSLTALHNAAYNGTSKRPIGNACSRAKRLKRLGLEVPALVALEARMVRKLKSLKPDERLGLEKAVRAAYERAKAKLIEQGVQ